MSESSIEPIAADVSLNSVTTTGAGLSFPVDPTLQDYGMQVVTTNATVTVALEGSINAGDPTITTANWFTLAQWVSGSNSNGDIVWATDKPVVAIRANVKSISGGGSVSAWITGNKFA